MPDTALTAATLSAALQESNVELCAALLETLGAARCQILLRATLDLEAHGGVPRAWGNHRRSAGGLFFKLAFTCCAKRDRNRIWKQHPRTADEEKRVALGALSPERHLG